jgi:voltage-gated potassium channel
MIIPTMGTDFWPHTPEGRVLCLGLAIYTFAIFGYITSNVASFLVAKDKREYNENRKILQAIEELKSQIELLKKEK